MFSIAFISAIRNSSTTILLITAGNYSLFVVMLECSRGGQLEIASIIGVIVAAVTLVTAIFARRTGLTVGIDS